MNKQITDSQFYIISGNVIGSLSDLYDKVSVVLEQLEGTDIQLRNYINIVNDVKTISTNAIAKDASELNEEINGDIKKIQGVLDKICTIMKEQEVMYRCVASNKGSSNKMTL